MTKKGTFLVSGAGLDVGSEDWYGLVFEDCMINSLYIMTFLKKLFLEDETLSMIA